MAIVTAELRSQLPAAVALAINRWFLGVPTVWDYQVMDHWFGGAEALLAMRPVSYS